MGKQARPSHFWQNMCIEPSYDTMSERKILFCDKDLTDGPGAILLLTLSMLHLDLKVKDTKIPENRK